MWTVEISKEAEQELKKAFTTRVIDRDDIEVIRRWLKDISVIGPNELMKVGKYDDHHIDGNWRGFRAACFSPVGRIIYKV